MSRILVVGSINMDVVARTKILPKPGETVFGSDLHFIPGGKGANQAVAAARLGGNVALAGKLGRDAFGKELYTFLQGESLDLSAVSFVEDVPTGTALISVDDESENVIIVIPGSNAHLMPSDIDALPIAHGDLIMSVFEIPQATIKALFARAKSAGARTLLNPAPAAPFIDGLLPLADVVILNETELGFYAGTTHPTSHPSEVQPIARQLQTRPDQTVIVTLGARGAACLHDGAFFIVPGRPVKALDSTGAGDCFCGALAVALHEGRPMEQAIAFANAAASLSVQRLGASASLPTRAELDALTGHAHLR